MRYGPPSGSWSGSGSQSLTLAIATSPLGLVIRTVRSRGYLLEEGQSDKAVSPRPVRAVATHLTVEPDPRPSAPPDQTSNPYPSTTVPTGPI